MSRKHTKQREMRQLKKINQNRTQEKNTAQNYPRILTPTCKYFTIISGGVLLTKRQTHQKEVEEIDVSGALYIYLQSTLA